MVGARKSQSKAKVYKARRGEAFKNIRNVSPVLLSMRQFRGWGMPKACMAWHVTHAAVQLQALGGGMGKSPCLWIMHAQPCMHACQKERMEDNEGENSQTPNYQVGTYKAFENGGVQSVCL